MVPTKQASRPLQPKTLTDRLSVKKCFTGTYIQVIIDKVIMKIFSHTITVHCEFAEYFFRCRLNTDFYDSQCVLCNKKAQLTQRERATAVHV